jgi:hypothetical protein
VFGAEHCVGLTVHDPLLHIIEQQSEPVAHGWPYKPHTIPASVVPLPLPAASGVFLPLLPHA